MTRTVVRLPPVYAVNSVNNDVLQSHSADGFGNYFSAPVFTILLIPNRLTDCQIIASPSRRFLTMTEISLSVK